ncbi:GntR family transcriptional regulator [Pseudarthrobacter sp. NIBRBAC000502770]|uniref:GntR family transcriptional regulator n=1 Tax=Pseudarthrobacter sp. NIBRBAC000502770 TaxID=2590785 RepID=UPI0011400F9B|nr:GntR family transcriptional regulator [Pseudarthrobacter sp. NIBRBAC000502770]QDG88182.1 GntR family transcriptional regulator [Pseudarthrobacter sp. NIBRBAC000502770]
MVERDGVRPVGKTEAVYQQLKSEIENGDFEPGQALTEFMLVEHTGASRTPVREALRRLAAEGLVNITPRIGATVARISLRSVQELFDYRRVLEPAAIRMVTEESATNAAIGPKFEDIEQRFAQLAESPDAEDFIAEFRELAEAFDMALIASTPNDHLSRAIRDLRPHTARLRRIAHADRNRLAEAIAEHRQMCRAILSGDADSAAVALRQHLFHVDEAIFRALMASGRGARGGNIDLVS